MAAASSSSSGPQPVGPLPPRTEEDEAAARARKAWKHKPKPGPGNHSLQSDPLPMTFTQTDSAHVNCQFFMNAAHGCRRNRFCRYVHENRETGEIMPTNFPQEKMQASVSLAIQKWVDRRPHVKQTMPWQAWAGVECKRITRTNAVIESENRVIDSKFVPRHIPETGRPIEFTLPPPVLTLIHKFLPMPQTVDRGSFIIKKTVMKFAGTNLIRVAETFICGPPYHIDCLPIMQRGYIEMRLHTERPSAAYGVLEDCARGDNGEFLLWHCTSTESALDIVQEGCIRMSENKSPPGVYLAPDLDDLDFYNLGGALRVAVAGFPLSKNNSQVLRKRHLVPPLGTFAHFTDKAVKDECVCDSRCLEVVSVVFHYGLLKQYFERHALELLKFLPVYKNIG